MLNAGFGAEPVRARRAVLLSLVFGFTALLVSLGIAVLSPDGWTLCKLLLLGCLVLNAPWLGLSAATGLIGFFIRMLARDPAAHVLPQLARAGTERPSVRTAIAVCVRDEDVAVVFDRLEAMARAIRAADVAGCFVLCVLSDTVSDAVARAERTAVEQLRVEGGVDVLYRQRLQNTGFKAGNVMSFLDDHAGRFELMLCLDADSEMALPTILRMVSVMEADPRMAILQATFHGQPARALFPRLFQFGHRYGLRIWAVGQAWWQADQGPYWGHNAIVRVAPFRAHCRLDPLPDGALILSHDHVEAARLQAARWHVRVLADDEGSTEAHPPTLPDYLERDVRWAAGNMQYRFLLGRHDLGLLGRFQMLQAILHYVLTPFWFALLPLSAISGAMGDAASVPRRTLALLLLAGWLTLHGPKLLGYLEVALRPTRAPPSRRTRNFLGWVIAEIAYTALLDPVIALHKTWAVLMLAAGRPTGWSGQSREERAIGWHCAARLFWPHTVTGVAVEWLFASTSLFAGMVGLIGTAGLILAIPFAVLTAGQRPSPRSKAVGASVASRVDAL